MSWDVAIIGGGVVGTAIARELAGYQLRCVLLEAADDVGTGTSKANTAILHTGFDATPGSLESRLVARGSALLRDYAQRTGIAVERTGALLVAWTREQAGSLDAIAGKSRANGYTSIRSVSESERLRAGAEPRPGRGRRAVDSRRVGHRPVVGVARVRDRGGARGRGPAARDAGHRGVGPTPAAFELAVAFRGRAGPLPVRGQRGGAGERRGGPDVRRRRLHDPARARGS